MKVHELKCWPEQYDQVKKGLKPFELRKGDRGYEPGDVLLLQKYNPLTKYHSKKNPIVCRVTCVLREFDGLKPGYVILGIKKYQEIPGL